MSGTLEPNLPTENISRLEQLKFAQDPLNSNSVVSKIKVNESVLPDGAATEATLNQLQVFILPLAVQTRVRLQKRISIYSIITMLFHKTTHQINRKCLLYMQQPLQAIARFTAMLL